MIKKNLTERFKEIYGTDDVLIFFSPGRVNLIGEHTDYNGGYVFPCALTYGTYLAVRPTTDGVIKFATMNFDYTSEVKVEELPKKHDNGAWVNYPMGVIDQFIRNGAKFSGMELLYFGNIPNGAGLSSSASMQIVSAVAFNHVCNAGFEMMEMVKMTQRSEIEFIGVNCGIMDQFIVGMGKENHALALKCDTLKWEAVPLNIAGHKLVIANTNKRRGLADSKYNERVAECQSAVDAINKTESISLLGDINYDTFLKVEGNFDNDVVKRRARHVITENKRVTDAIEALNNDNLVKFGELMNASHDSLRDDYEVTGIELDTLVEEARKIDGTVGSRMTGAGFGGCTVSLVKDEAIDTFKEVVGKNYNERTGLTADFYVAEIGDGAKMI